MIRNVFFILCFCALALPALAAITPDEIMKDPVLEARARALYGEIRCPVCDSQSLEGSDSDVAQDLRALVRERLLAGDTNAEILDTLQDHYGDVILMTPPVKNTTWLLWFGPLSIFLLAGIGTLFMIRKAGAP